MTQPDEWPDTLPKQQAPADSYQDGATFTDFDTLHGPARRRRQQKVGRATWSFEVWFTSAQAEIFNTWYESIVKDFGGAFVIPWMSRSRVVAFVSEYQLVPLGTGWRLTGTVLKIRDDPSRCDAFLNQTFGNRLIDPWDTANIFLANDLTAVDIWKDDFDLQTIATEVC